jgi:carboxyvinyl-carboxyphosphonate phosphorylmutase
MPYATPTELRQRFRALLRRERITNPASVFDAASARLADAAGAELGLFAGSIASAVIVGAPDLVLITLTEFAEQARRICRAGALPLIVDADHGYGNALNVMRTVEELETAGVSALTIEDTLLPAPFGGSDRSAVSHDEYLQKLRAAIAARRDPSLVISGRTGSLARGETLEQAVEWVRVCEAAGVDLIMVQGASNIDQVRGLAAATTRPLILNAQAAPNDDLHRLGVRIVFQGHLSYFAMLRELHDSYVEQFTTGSTAGLRPKALSPELQALAFREEEYAARSDQYLSATEQASS